MSRTIVVSRFAFFQRVFFAWVFTLATTLSLPLQVTPVYGCGGNPPPATCGRTVAMAKVVPGVIVANPTAPVTVVLPVVVVLGLAAFPPGSNVCPPPPYLATVNLTIGCIPGSGATGTSGQVAIPPGINVINVPVIIPPGPPRTCFVTGQVIVDFTDGVQIQNLGDTVMCIQEQSPSDPTLARLEAVLQGDAIRSVHAGSQSRFTVQVTNNDPDNTFRGIMTATTSNSSRLPVDPNGTGNVNDGVYSISDPEFGDDPPVLFDENLDEHGCVPLPPNPQDTINPSDDTEVVIAPGETKEVSFNVRTWGMCANGSCSEVVVKLVGNYDNGDPGEACVGTALVVDNTVAPQYLWDDSGAVVEINKAADELGLIVHGDPRQDEHWDVDLRLDSKAIETSVPIENVEFSFSEATSFLGTETQDYGRIRVDDFALDAPIPADSEIGVTFRFGLSGVNGESVLMEGMSAVPGAPHGFADQAPLGMGVARVNTGLPVDTFFDIFYQVEFLASTSDGFKALPIRDLTLTPDVDGFLVNFTAISPGASVIQLNIKNDFRGFARGDTVSVSKLVPGDTNIDGKLNIADPVYGLNLLFAAAPAPACFIDPDFQFPVLTSTGLAVFDFNGDGGLNIGDPVAQLNNMFGGGGPHFLGSSCRDFVNTPCADSCQ